MKKRNSLPLFLMALAALTACGGKTSATTSASGNAGASEKISSSEKVIEKVKVTYDYNYTGSTATVVEIEKGKKATKPTDPTRTGFTFNGWYTDAATSTAFDFDTAISEDLTLYAGWLDSSKTYYTVTFDLNYDGAPTASTLKVEANKYVTLPSSPTRDGYEFVNWFTEATCENKFKIVTPVTGDMTLYASWIKQYTFEAEYVDDIVNMSGAGYSGTATGYELIKKDKGGAAKASNGYYVTYLYYKGAELDFKITSDTDVTDAKLILRLSAEVMDVSLTTEDYNVVVNDSMIGYSQINITNVPAQGSGQTKEFADFTLTKKLSLKQGENVIKLITNNTKKMFGTMDSTAPMIDCMKISTNANLVFANEEKDNINYVD